jgi:NAD(P)-dependent dehydrogenase (short-subunit alcohol dehydrogenase family)
VSDSEYLTSLFGLSGRVALVTGARHGLGRALALALARAGASVAITSRDAAGLTPVASELEALGADALPLGVELRDAAAAEQAVSAAADWKGRLDIVVNNAGVSIRRPAVDYSLDEWDEVIETNLRAAFVVARAAVAQMAGHGRIINISSTYAISAAVERAPYAASKAGLEQLTRVLALEWASAGITVNAVAPGATPTETRAELLKGAQAQARQKQIPLGRLGTPDDIVGAVLLLASDAGQFITGQTIVVDGGYTLGASV